MDEQNHLARGVTFLSTGDPRLSLEHPPLVNSLSALPVYSLTKTNPPIDHESWQSKQWYVFADLLLWERTADVIQTLFLARFPILLLTLGLALVGYRAALWVWASSPAALLLFLFLLFDPNIMAHGRYTTTDLGGTAFAFLAMLVLWWSWEELTAVRFLLVALTLGLAFGSKLSTLVFVPIVALLGFVDGWRMGIRRLLWLGCTGLASILVVWALFGFEWGAFIFQRPDLAFLNMWQGPMPTFWAGVEQILGVSGGNRPSFLQGQVQMGGWPSYFWVAFAVKTPLPTLLMLLFLIGKFLATERPFNSFKVELKKGILTGGTAVCYFLIASQSNLNIGYRHLLPMLPFLYLFIAGGLAHVHPHPVGERKRNFVPQGGGVFLLALPLILINLWIFPHYLSYFNVIGGGANNGHKVLLDSNIDWGQDLLRLQTWMQENEVETVKLGWYGTADPSYYNINYEPLPGLGRAEFWSRWYPPPFNPQQPEKGVYAISASNLWESHWEQRITYNWFLEQEPDAKIGYSIFIYVVE